MFIPDKNEKYLLKNINETAVILGFWAMIVKLIVEIDIWIAI